MRAQRVTFAGAQTILPFSDLNVPTDAAVDTLGNVFVVNLSSSCVLGMTANCVLELPKTATGYGAQAILPYKGQFPESIAVDGAEDVFVLEDAPYVLELPWTGTGYGAQVSLPLPANVLVSGGVALDRARDVFVTYNSLIGGSANSVGSVYEYPWSATGYGSPRLLPFGGLSNNLGSIAVDSAGDVFISDVVVTLEGNGGTTSQSFVVKLPKTGTGYGQAINLPISSFSAADSAGDLFFLDSKNDVDELPWTGSAYGPLITLAPTSGLNDPAVAAVDSQGNFFIADTGNNRIVEMQRSSVNFGSVNFCASGVPAPCAETLTLNYKVTASGTLGTPKVLTDGAPDLDFTLASGSPCTGSVKEGSFCTVNVTFTPLASGIRNGTVEIIDGSGTVLATTMISGFGSTPEAQLSTTYLPFGPIPFGTTETLPVTITNSGGGLLTVAPPSIIGKSYTITGNSCAGQITPGQGCAMQVQFSPYSIATHDDFLTLNTDGGNFTVDLVGKVIGLSVLGGVNGAPLQFGSVASGSSKVETLTVTNVGLPGTVAIGTATTAGSASSPYAILSTGENTCLAGIGPGQSCTLPIKFAPTSSGTHDDLLTLTPSAGGGSKVWLLGTTP